MRWSALFIPTLRENPADGGALSQQLLTRAGYLRLQSPGVFSYLTLGQRSLLKIVKIVREEMQALGAQEMQFPVLHRTADAIASIAQGELRSYRQLPQIWYQIQPKLDQDSKSRIDLQRARRFLTAELYSLDLDAARREVSYQKQRAACSKMLDRLGLKHIEAEARAGAAFLIASESGDDIIARCAGCFHAAERDIAASRATPPICADPEGDHSPEPFHTPGRKTIADVADFTGLPETSQMKSLVLVADGNPVLALVRGDHSLSETKFARAMKVGEFRPAHSEELRGWFGAEAGSLGPIGVNGVRIIADEALRGRRNMIAGANKDDYHLRNVTPGEDFQLEYFDLREVAAGETCVRCGAALDLARCEQVARISKLSCPEAASLHVQNEAREETPVMLGACQIGIDRILFAMAGQFHDQDGIAFSPAVAPFDVVITPVFPGDAAQRSAAEQIYGECRNLNLSALFDDRDERPGVKFKDADLIGIPYRITIGRKVAQGAVEVVDRRTRKVEETGKDQAASIVAARVHL
jgi:prolyl-tRNA synthetase